MRRRLRTFALSFLALLLTLGVVQTGGYLLFAGRCRNLTVVRRYYRPGFLLHNVDEWVCIQSDAGPGERQRIEAFLDHRFAHVFFDEKDIPGRYSVQTQEGSSTRKVYNGGRILRIWDGEGMSRPFLREIANDTRDGRPSGKCHLIMSETMVWCLYRWVPIEPDDWAWKHLQR